MSILPLDRVVTAVPDLNDLLFGDEIDIDAAEYARIMRRITIGDNGTDTDVSAFNSSI